MLTKVSKIAKITLYNMKNPMPGKSKKGNDPETEKIPPIRVPISVLNTIAEMAGAETVKKRRSVSKKEMFNVLLAEAITARGYKIDKDEK